MKDKEEFNKWFANASARWPTDFEWFAKSRSAKDQKATLEIWLEMFEFVDLPDALEANKQIHEAGQKINIDTLPANVKRIATAIRISRRTNPEEDWRRTAVKCRNCMDRGRVTVWHNKALRYLAANGRIVPGRGIPPMTAVARCSCEPGAIGRDSDNPMPRYDNDGYCLLQGSEMSEESQQAAIEWLAARKKSPNEDLAEWSA